MPRLNPCWSSASNCLEESLDELQGIGEWLPGALGKKVTDKFELKHRVMPDFRESHLWVELCERVERLRKGCHELAEKLVGLLRLCEPLPDAVAEKLNSTMVDLGGIAGRLEGLGGRPRLISGCR